ncbi:glycosyltransferase family protein [Sutcliffiella horikoshii]|uniref:Glycosyltransferase family 4 protein n=1 Tax=Sutcliffiella horikoshii TaxID=79883 RepID=A0A5D4T697_9BACI|nr:glycosyltransferase family 4 protein [Sutcliffiella horikoshii]TYS70002.1 glycosyltransferase family 4 protein [Sutcliffiella horikoshii]
MKKKKVCFITTRNIFNTTCLPRYAKILNDDFDIIYWDQHGIEENCGANNHYKFEYKMPYGKGKLKKAIGYLKFKNFAINIIKKNKYDSLILLPTQTGLLFSKLLMTKYKGRFILDIRDYTAENNILIYQLEKKVIHSSGITVITSPAYKTFLPKHEYLISHNITKIDQEVINMYRKRTNIDKEKIVISCIGSIRFIDQFKKVIQSFANDDRFELRFIGRGSENLNDYCMEKSIKNVMLKGRFNSEDTIGYYLDTDIIMNLYGNNNPFLDYALSNKLYYAATLGIPILVCPNTYMEDVTVSNGFGFTYDLDNPQMSDKLYEYYQSIDWDKFYNKSDKYMESVNMDENIFMKSIRDFIKGG